VGNHGGEVEYNITTVTIKVKLLAFHTYTQIS
jgi:hypothetical protein